MMTEDSSETMREFVRTLMGPDEAQSTNDEAPDPRTGNIVRSEGRVLRASGGEDPMRRFARYLMGRGSSSYIVEPGEDL